MVDNNTKIANLPTLSKQLMENGGLLKIVNIDKVWIDFYLHSKHFKEE